MTKVTPGKLYRFKPHEAWDHTLGASASDAEKIVKIFPHEIVMFIKKGKWGKPYYYYCFLKPDGTKVNIVLNSKIEHWDRIEEIEI
jgi:hypothetical protein